MLCCNDRQRTALDLNRKKTKHYILTELCYYLRLKQNAKFKNLTNRRADEIIDKQISFYEKKLDELREKN